MRIPITRHARAGRAARAIPLFLLVACLGLALACGGKKPPVARVAPPPPPPAQGSRPPSPPEPVAEPPVVPPEPVPEDRIASASLDDLNKNSPLKPVFFDLDSSDLSAEGQRILNGNASVLKQHATWTITIEGHCDERGSAEYNLALG